jgi:cyclic beta-1,2-glucan synthetase
MTADVSSGFPNTGKGGWSWYTGAAGWMYRAILNNFLGIRKEGNQLVFEPCVSASFRRYQIEYKFGRSLYEITVLNESNTGCDIGSIHIDGVMHENNRIDLIDDGAVRHVEIRMEKR